MPMESWRLLPLIVAAAACALLGKRFLNSVAGLFLGGIGGAFGTLAANAFGLHDMLGNVWEWCQSATPASRDAIRAAGTPQVARGGAWDVTSEADPDSLGVRLAPDTRSSKHGFRPARDLTR